VLWVSNICLPLPTCSFVRRGLQKHFLILSYVIALLLGNTFKTRNNSCKSPGSLGKRPRLDHPWCTMTLLIIILTNFQKILLFLNMKTNKHTTNIVYLLFLTDAPIDAQQNIWHRKFNIMSVNHFSNLGIAYVSLVRWQSCQILRHHSNLILTGNDCLGWWSMMEVVREVIQEYHI
jgi:hypothetical protein